MPINVVPKQYPILDEDIYVAICIAVVDLGTQPSRDYGPMRNVWFDFEFPENKQEDGRPHRINATYSFSLGDKARLRKMLKSWRGVDLSPAEMKEGFDVGQMLGVAARIMVEHNTGNTGKTYANIGSIKPFKGKPPASETDQIEFSIDDATEIPKSLPPFIQEKIRLSPEWKEKTNPTPDRSLAPSAPIDNYDSPADADDIPF